MPAPSKLAIATKSLNRLVKEEASYHKERQQQISKIAKLEQGSSDENAEYTLRQERKALEETEALFPRLKEGIRGAMQNLESQLEQSKGSAEEGTEAERAEAEKAVAAAQNAIHETS